MATIACPHCGSGVGVGKLKCPVCYGAIDPVAGAEDATPAGAPAAQAPPAATADSGTPATVTMPPPAPPPPIGLAARPAAPQAAPTPQPLAQGSPPAAGASQSYGGAPQSSGGYASAPPLSGMGGGEVRVSLTGEVIESAPAPAPRQSSTPLAGMGAAPAPMGVRPGPPSGMPPRTGAQSRFGQSIPYESPEETASGGKSKTIVGGIAILVIALGSLLGWFYFKKTHAPADAATKFLDAYVQKDWTAMYNGFYFDPATKSALDAAGGQTVVTAQLEKLSSLVELTAYKVETVTSTAAGKDVKTMLSYTPHAGAEANQGQATEVTLSMVQDNGTWKVDSKSFNQGILAGLTSMGITVAIPGASP